MVNFPNISNHWAMIASPTVLSTDDSSHLIGSLKGRGICLFHTLATPFKALSSLGRLVMSVVETAYVIFATLTLNAHPKELLQAAANIVDVVGGAALLPFALIANVIRGVVGTIIYPAAMIQDASAYITDEHQFKADHNLLYGTFVNYPV